MRFVTPVYHPNIDAGGRICLSVLKTGDKARAHGALLRCRPRALRRHLPSRAAQGDWKPALNVATGAVLAGALTAATQLLRLTLLLCPPERSAAEHRAAAVGAQP
jgi:ubiquitin-protein ligase